jgi:dTDP-4-amino-4,6-dideoxygalactose transaminase
MDSLTASNLHRAIAEGGSGNAGIVGDLEAAFTKLLGARYGLCTSSGTAALICALRAVGVRPGGRVGVSALGPAMTGLAISAVGARPVFLDAAGPSSFGVAPAASARAVEVGLAAVVLVPMWGYWDETSEALDAFRDAGVPIIVDAAQAPFLRLRGDLCTIADVVCLSLHARKPFKAGEGGVCLTNHRHLAERVVTVRNFGQAATGEGERLVPTGAFGSACGANFKINALGAAWCLAQVNTLAQVRERFDRLRGDALEAFRAAGVGWSEAAQADEVVEHGRYGIAVICATRADAATLADTLARRRVEVDTSRYEYRPMYSCGALSRYETPCPVAEHVAAHTVACRLEAFHNPDHRTGGRW